MAQIDSNRDTTAALLPIGAVVREVGRSFPDVTHSSLRFLEREGLVSATRTSGGHRLYTAADVDRIRQIKQWQLQRHSLEEIRDRLARLDRLPALPFQATRFLDLAVSGDFAAAYQMVIDVDEVGLPLADLFGGVLQPALIELGRRWAGGTVRVSQEKEITELARELIVELTRRHAPPNPAGPTFVAACVAGERHELGLRMVCGLLRSRGAKISFLGADVDAAFLLEAVQLHQPAAVLLSARFETSLPTIEAAVDTLRSALPHGLFPLIFVGGQVTQTHTGALMEAGIVSIHEETPAAACAAVMSAAESSPSRR